MTYDQKEKRIKYRGEKKKVLHNSERVAMKQGFSRSKEQLIPIKTKEASEGFKRDSFFSLTFLT